MPAASCGRTDRRGDFRRRQLGGDPHAKIRPGQPAAAQMRNSRPPCRRTARSASSGCAGFGAGVGRALPCVRASRSPTMRPPSWWSRPSAPGPSLRSTSGRAVCWPDATNRSRPSRPMASSFTPRPRPPRPAARPRSPPSALPHWRPAPPTASAPQARSSTGRPIAVDHIGSEAETVLLATFATARPGRRGRARHAGYARPRSGRDVRSRSTAAIDHRAGRCAPPSELAQAPTDAGEHIAPGTAGERASVTRLAFPARSAADAVRAASPAALRLADG